RDARGTHGACSSSKAESGIYHFRQGPEPHHPHRWDPRNLAVGLRAGDRIRTGDVQLGKPYFTPVTPNHSAAAASGKRPLRMKSAHVEEMRQFLESIDLSQL